MSERTIYFEFGSNEFEWDEEKAQLNLAKHGIAFVEAASAFEDQFAVVLADEEHSLDEVRFLLLGRTTIVVCSRWSTLNVRCDCVSSVQGRRQKRK